jgi:hypothetical protein
MDPVLIQHTRGSRGGLNDLNKPDIFNFILYILRLNSLNKWITLAILGIIHRHIFRLKHDIVVWIKDRTMDNVQNCDSYINIPSSQTYRQHNLLGS